MHRYRTHTCGELRAAQVGTRARISGWVHRRRDHGGLVFIDLRDNYGLTQCVVEPDSAAFKAVDGLRSEFVATFTGVVTARPGPHSSGPNGAPPPAPRTPPSRRRLRFCCSWLAFSRSRPSSRFRRSPRNFERAMFAPTQSRGQPSAMSPS